MAWAKLHTDILGDPKLLRAARKGAKSLVVLPWLIAFAQQADDEGRLTVGGEPAEAEDIAALLPGVTARQVADCLAALEGIGVLARAGQTLRFAAWERRAGKPSDSVSAIRERVQKHRETKRAARAQGTDSPAFVTPCNAESVTPGNALDTEEEEEGEEEGEKNRIETHTRRARVTPASALPAASPPAGCPAGFDAAWARYPRRAGGNPRRDAEQAWTARLREGADPAAMLAGVERYRAYCEAEGQIGTRFVMQAARFFGPSRRYEEPWLAGDALTEGETADDRALEARAAAVQAQIDADQAWLAGRGA